MSDLRHRDLTLLNEQLTNSADKTIDQTIKIIKPFIELCKNNTPKRLWNKEKLENASKELRQVIELPEFEFISQDLKNNVIESSIKLFR